MNSTQVALYLDSLKEFNGREFQAMRAAGITRHQLMKYRETNPEFVEMEQDIVSEVSDKIREEVWRRAMDGIDQGVYHKGEMIDTQKRYSDSLLAILARAKCAEFANKTELTSGDGGPLRIEIADFSHLKKPAEEIATAVVQAAVAAQDYGDVL